MTNSIVLIVDDLMFLPRLENTLNHLGYPTSTATNKTDLTQALLQAPVLIIVDLFSQSIDWVTLIQLAKKSTTSPVPVLGFGPHIDLSLREQALAAGCNAVVGRGAVATQLPNLIKKYAVASQNN